MNRNSRNMMKFVILALLLTSIILQGVNTISFASGDLPNANGADGSPAKPFIINEESDLDWLSANYSSYKTSNFLQTADITLTKAWTPLGDDSKQFTGTYNGNGHTISNLSINNAALTYVGMFGFVGSGTIKNLTLSNVSITAGQSVTAFIGAFAGKNTSGTIERCHVTSTDTSTYLISGANQDDIAGGIAGHNGGHVRYCSNMENLNNDAGRLVDGTAPDTIGAGGAFTKAITTTGGIVGINTGTIEYCYNRGNISTGNISMSGGIAGQNYGAGSIINNCYSTGNVTVINIIDTSGWPYYSTGAIIGLTDSTSGISGNLYLTGASAHGIGDDDASFKISNANPSESGAIAKSAEELKLSDTYAGWGDFSTYWIIDALKNDGYPIGKEAPIVTDTDAAGNITLVSATVGGSATSNGGGAISEWGIEYRKITDNSILKQSLTSGDPGGFTVNLPDLIPNTQYYAIAYAKNEIDTSYGEPVTFTTLPTAPLLSVTLCAGSALGSTQAIITGAPTNKYVVNVTDASVGYIAASDPAPTSGANFIDNYVSGSDIINGVLTGEYLQVYDVDNDGKVVKFYETKLISMHLKNPPSSLPINEGFENGGDLPANWSKVTLATSPDGNIDWSARSNPGVDPACTPYNGSYMAEANFYMAGEGATGRLMMNNDFPLAAGASYEFSFYMFHSTAVFTDATGTYGESDTIQPQISLDSGATWLNLDAPILRTSADGWVKHTLSLNDYAGNPSVRVGLLAISDYGYNAFIDDVEIKRLLKPAKALTADITNNDTGYDIEITFAADAAFEGAVTSISFAGNALDPSQYVVGSGKITLKPGVNTGNPSLNGILRTPKTGNVVITAEDYYDSTVPQTINAGTVSSLAITTQPVPGATSGDQFATQPVIELKDQYGNTCSSGVSAAVNVTASAKAGTGTWTIGGTTTKSAAAGIVTFNDLTCTLASPGNGSITFSCGAVSANSGIFTIPINSGKVLTADTTDNNIDNDMEITFATDAAFEGAVTGISFTGSTLDPSQYVVGSGKITLKPSVDTGNPALNNILRTPKTGNVIITAYGYNDSTVAQTINAGAVSSLTITTQPVPGAASGDQFATQPVVVLKDQYGNTCSSGASSTANVTASAKAGTGTWIIGGTITKSATAGIATFNDMTCTLTSLGSGSITFSSGAVNANSVVFTIPINSGLVLTADVTDNTVDNDIEITFAADAAFEGAVTGVSFAGSTLDPSQYVVGSGKITLKPGVDTGNSVLNGILRTPKTGNVVITANGYNNSTVVQTIQAGAVASLSITTQPVPGTASGDQFTTQPVIELKDQYGNTCSNGVSATANITASAKAGTGTWIIAGTTTKPAAAGVATFNDLTCTLTSLGNGSITFSCGAVNASSGNFTIPVSSGKVLSADITDNNIDNDIEIAFAADAAFEGAITGVSFAGSTLDPSQYVVGSGKITLKPVVDTGNPALNSILRTPKTGNVVITANGYNNSTVVQTTQAGAVASLAITTQPVPGAASGDPFNTQPVVALKDQYGNTCSSGVSATANVIASAKAGTGTWTIGGTTTKPAAAGVATFNDLTCTLTSPGNGSITFSCGSVNANSGIFTIPVNGEKTLTADVTNNNVDNDIEITFGADAAFEGAVTGVSFAGSTLDPSQYVVGSGKITLKPGIDTGNPVLNGILRTPKTGNVVITANGYIDSIISQTIKHGNVIAMVLIQDIKAPAVNGGQFSSQPKIALKDQYGNTAVTDNITQVTVSRKDAGSWTLSGTTSGKAVNGVVTFSGLGATNSSAVTGAQLAFNSAGLSEVVSSIVALPAPSSTGGDDVQPPPAENTEILIDGNKENIGTETTETIGNQTVTTVTIDPVKLDQTLENGAEHPTITISAHSDSDVVVTELNGQSINTLQGNGAIIGINTDIGNYSLPTQEINIDEIADQLGADVPLSGIKVQVKISRPQDDVIQVVENSAKKGEFTIVAPPVDFTVSYTYGDKTVEATGFNSYIARAIPIPDGVDPQKITTGVIVDPDGTVRQVPTKIIIIGGKYYAQINSLTNSTYSVIWNPIMFSDVARYGAIGEIINDLGSRLIISGVGNGLFAPERDITRAEFAVIMVKALGLKPGTESNPFSDVKETSGYCPYIETAYEYGIISGYGNGKFGPDDKITREQAMMMIGNAMKITGLKVPLAEGEINKLLSGFGDGFNTAAYAKSSVASCIKSGITSGRSGKRIAPKEYITRAEVAVMINKLLQLSGLI